MRSNTDELTYGGKLITNETELIYFAIGFVVINAALRIMVNRYPLRIYKNSGRLFRIQELSISFFLSFLFFRYLAVFESQIPLRKTKFEFLKGDVVSVPPTGVLPWRESRYKINNRNVLLLIDYFKAPSELFEMMEK